MNLKDIIRFRKLFFNNLGVKQTIIKNTFWLTIGDVGSRLLKLILLIYVARILGATEYGKFSFALSFVLLFNVFADMGLNQIIVREFSKEDRKEKDFSSLLSLKILLGLGVLVLIFIFSFGVTSDSVVRKVIWILALSNIISNVFLMFYAFLQARQKMEYEGIIRISEALLLVGIGLAVLFYYPSIENLSFSYLLASGFSLIVILLFFHSRIQRVSLSFSKLIWKKYLSMSWPLALISLSYIIYNRIDSVMMGCLGQITQTGWYNAAYRIVTMTIIPTGIISTSFFPILSKSVKETKEKFQKIWNYLTEIMILLAAPLVVGGVVLSPRIINFIYDESFSPSILAFQILIVMAGIIFLYNSFRWVLIAADQQKKLFFAVLSGAIINVILNLILIPKYSLYGAAIATVITHILILILLIDYTLKFTTIRPFNLKIIISFVGAILSSLGMYFVIIQPQIYYLNVVLTVLIGAGIYSVCILGYKKLVNRYLWR
ncbi:oligosaccharide flippase family protein [bacterium]|nr:oligosaccharide flippase family protein [bacterium]